MRPDSGIPSSSGLPLKTEASEAPVPVIVPLRKILDAWKAKAKVSGDGVTDGCWTFEAGFTRKGTSREPVGRSEIDAVVTAKCPP